MKITLITPTYNSSKTITRTIDSIVSQNIFDLEYIIVDGNSKDNTLDLIEPYKKIINIKVISEKDEGIYDAMNKGIKMASGEIIGIINSDDLFYSNDILKKVKETFSLFNGLDCVYGDIVYFSKNPKKTTRIWSAGEYEEDRLNYGWAIPHPSMFIKKTIYEKYGLYNKIFKIAGDYEFILRVLKIHKIKTKYIKTVFVRMQNDGKSGKNIKNRFLGWKELQIAWSINNLKKPRFFILKRVLYKLNQFF